LSAISKTDARCLIEYYGLDDGVYKTYDSIAKEMGCTSSNVGRRISRAMETFRRHVWVKFLATFTDSDIGYSEETKDQFDILKLQDIYTELLEKEKEENKRKFEQLSEEDRRAEYALDALLNQNFFSYDWNIRIDRSVYFDLSHCTIKDILESCSLEKFKKPGYSSVASVLRNFGLQFLEEFEYVKDWRDACIQGIKNYGVEKLINIMGLIVSDNVEMVNLLNSKVDVLNFGTRIETILNYNKIKTIGDLISIKESELIRYRNMGKGGMAEIISKLESLGLQLCPEELTRNEWIQSLLKGEKGLQGAEDMSEIKEEVEDTPKEKSAIEKLLETDNQDLDFSQRVKNCLYRNRIETLKDLVVLRKKDIMRFRNFGAGCYADLITVLSDMGLSLRPNGVTEEDWLEKIKNSQNMQENKDEQNPQQQSEQETERKIEVEEKKPEAIREKIDLDNIPDNLKKYVCRGVGEDIENEMNNSTYEILIHRAQRNLKLRRIPEADKKPIPKIKYNYNNMGEISDNIIQYVGEDLNSIYSLSPEFIEKHKDELSIFVLQERNLSVNERLRLINFINNPKIDELEQE
jgi:hypothetical protein